MKRSYKRIIGSRLIVTALAVLIQLTWLWGLLEFLAPYALPINIVLTVLAVLFVLYVASKRDEPAYKILWLICILAFPLFGAILYLGFGDKKTSRPLHRRLEKAVAEIGPPKAEADAAHELEQESPHMAQIFHYASRLSRYPVQRNRDARYYPSGEAMFPVMLRALEQAEKYIYLEYFIISEGKMWQSMLATLVQKAACGVDVRIIYDDLGSLTTLPPGYAEYLRRRNIKCVSFNPMRLFLSGTLNNRDHRKILVIDGKVAFSGGINLADEYINRIEKYGYWKDGGFRLEGPAVQNYVQMFAEFWNAFSKDPLTLPDSCGSCPPEQGDGYVLPYCDSPANRDAVSNHLYMELLGQATQYAWFFTPYLMLGDTLLDAFVRAAQRGVDVRIFVPGVPDKKLAYRMTQSFFRPLLEAGVRIYTYTPGFLHAKACLIDDEIGMLGTVNLDYRSLFLHFECNALFYRASLLRDLKRDFEETLPLCKEITQQDLRKALHSRMVDSILRIISPLC